MIALNMHMCMGPTVEHNIGSPNLPIFVLGDKQTAENKESSSDVQAAEEEKLSGMYCYT